MQVLAFHGQGSNPNRMRYDCGNPDWITGYPDWQKGFQVPRQPFCAVGYSLGGSFVAELTHTSKLAGVVVYESPILGLLPRRIEGPVVIVWNNYEPMLPRRQREKAFSIARWKASGPNTQTLTGKYWSHVKLIPRPPFVGQAWDQGLNPILSRHLLGHS